ncbi:thialysine N-epsilon-acetyltransferase-like isoform X2 [Pelobates fuscus]|uniref:thialysine N-epsilon-acetyltransferase-like isoform X1 n=1 Tax=Pelobates fuscus TaxID=191477 RepID=UPI002FE4C98E
MCRAFYVQSVCRMVGYTVRAAEPGDCEDIMRMIKELAEFEKLPDQVKTSADVLRRDGFEEPSPLFKCLVAELEEKDREDGGPAIVGYALSYFIYSTWKGRALYLEDLYVMPAFRGKGIGSTLFVAVAKSCMDLGCCHLQLSCLDWNSPAISFYMSRGALNLSKEEGWRMFRFPPDALRRITTDPAVQGLDSAKP